MSDRNEPEPGGGPGTAPEEPPRGTAGYSVPEAARALGISERAVRKRIVAGTLPAEKEGPRWVVFLPAGTRTGPGAVLGEPAGPQAVLEVAQGAVPGGPDLEPLAAVISDLTRANRQLAEAAAVWQFRALQAEDRLKALAAGPTAPDTGEPPSTEAATRPQEAQAAPAPAAMQDTPRGLLARLRAIFSGP